MKSLNFKLGLLQGAYFAAYCVLFAFLVPLFREWGYSDFMIGVLTTLSALANTVAQPLFGLFTDQKGHIKTLFLCSMSTSMGLILFLPLGESSIWFAAILTLLLTAGVFSMSALLDTWTLKLRNDGEQVNYSFTRSIGPFVYAFVAAGFGSLLDLYGDWLRIPAFIGLTVIVLIVSWFVPAPSHIQTTEEEQRNSETIRLLLANRPYVLFLVSVLLVCVGYNAMISFYPLLVNELGGGNTEIGIALFIAAMSQVPILMLYSVLEKKFLGVRFWLGFSMICFELKGILLAMSPNLAFSIYIQGLEFFSWGIFLPASMSYINQIVDRKAFASATMIFFAITYGLGAMIGNFSGGILSNMYGVRTMMIIENCFAFLGFVWFVGVALHSNRRNR
jgi:PPP family 3-phenylpropionic acid transporter